MSKRLRNIPAIIIKGICGVFPYFLNTITENRKPALKKQVRNPEIILSRFKGGKFKSTAGRDDKTKNINAAKKNNAYVFLESNIEITWTSSANIRHRTAFQLFPEKPVIPRIPYFLK